MDKELQIPTGTVKLLDDEHAKEVERRNKIGRIALQIEELFIKEDITMGDLAEIMDLFNARAHKVFSNFKIKDIKEKYV